MEYDKDKFTDHLITLKGKRINEDVVIHDKEDDLNVGIRFKM